MEPVRTLIIEDDEGTIALLASFLKGLEGFALSGVARDGREGLARLREERPGLVLLDIIMPRMDGLQVLEALRRDPPERKPYIIVLSGVASDVTVQRALELGAGFYMVKPVNLAALADRIHDRFRRLPPSAPGAGAAEALARWRLREMGGPEDRDLPLVCTAAAALAGGGEDTVLKVAYAEVKRVHGVDYVNAEGRIRRYIGRVHRGDSPGYRAFVGRTPEGRPPSSGQFLRRLAEQIRRGMGDTPPGSV